MARDRRGPETQNAVAGYYRGNGWPFAESAGSGRAGTDVTNMPGIDVEVKGRRGFSPLEAMKQLKERGKEGVLAFAVLRPNGFGTSKVGDWLVVRRLEDDTKLLRQAGYGDPDE